MNLPPDLCKRRDLTCCVGLTPPPKEPDFLSISNILSQLTPTLQEYWTGKVIETHDHPGGRDIRIGLLPEIGDRPAIAKVTGWLGHSATCLCSWCKMKKKDLDIFNPEIVKAHLRTNESVSEICRQWKNAKTNKERGALETHTGVRWTPVHDLTYYKPVDHIVLGFVHNMLEGILQTQLRDIYKIGPRPATILKEKMQLLTEEQDNDDSFEWMDDSDIEEARSEVASLHDEETPDEQRAIDLIQSEQIGLDTPLLEQREGSPGSDDSSRTARPMGQDDDLEDSDYEDLEDYKHLPLLNTNELTEVRTFIAVVGLPTCVDRPPVNLGDKNHGKIKAKIELTLWALIFPMILPVLWAKRANAMTGSNSDDERWSPQKYEDNFYHLVACVNFVSDYSTSDTMAEAYTEHYTKFRETQGQLWPKFKPKPNHHYALHYEAQLKYWGALGLLNEFDGEASNGAMQKIPTNRRTCTFKKFCEFFHTNTHTADDLDYTILHVSCAAGRLMGQLIDTQLEPLSTEHAAFAAILQPLLEDPLERTFLPEEAAHFLARAVDLGDDEYDALLAYLQARNPQWGHYMDGGMLDTRALVLPHGVRLKKEIEIEKKGYSQEASHKGKSRIQFTVYNGNKMVMKTGVIQKIWQTALPNEESKNIELRTFILVEEHETVPNDDRGTSRFHLMSELRVNVAEAYLSGIRCIIEPHNVVSHVVTHTFDASVFKTPRDVTLVSTALDRGRHAHVTQ